MRDWKRIVGANIRDLRKAKKRSQEWLAGEADIDLTYVGGIERGKRNPSLFVLVGIAKALGVQPADLLKRR
jgi:transcriptional regulator with XRE-family HTH domain